ncbi:AIPR family protein [Bradyrhizobium sp.]|uniref:AIPR family protein n=1 Tax=Bradyrhizobium sp. TaxID=376 RepID=UPI0025BB3CEF|nr:AIPR family protein [Bradyrhizobium sp.]
MSSLIQIIDHIVEEARKQTDPNLKVDDFFELFVSDLTTRDSGLDWDDIESGIVDGENDGQIDAVYVLVDGILIREKKDFDPSSARRNASIRVIIQQSKNSPSFSENSFAKMRTSVCDLFNLDKKIPQLKKSYNAALVAQADLFRAIYLGMQGRNPTVQFDVIFASKGDRATANAKISTDGEAIVEFFKAGYFKSGSSVKLLGARELIDLANRSRFINKKMSFVAPPASDGASEGWVGLVQLGEFFRLITDDDKKLLASIFEENVRDFEGDAGVNREIAETLSQASDNVDFWWLNNGITILCDEVQPHTQREFSLDRPLIVNGLQTANKIWQHFHPQDKISDKRNVLVRVIKSTDEIVRDRIIRATNRQTPIGPSQLRATERLHRDIEGFFKARGKYYERRKNQYKNAGRPRRDIFSINELAQAIIAIALGRPNDARARPSSLLNTVDGYGLIFPEKADLKFFAFCADTVRKVESYLAGKTASRKERNNLKFYVAYLVPRLIVGREQLARKDLVKLLDRSIDTSIFDTALTECQKRFAKLGADDDVARGSELIGLLRAGLPALVQSMKNKKPKVK